MVGKGSLVEVYKGRSRITRFAREKWIVCSYLIHFAVGTGSICMKYYAGSSGVYSELKAQLRKEQTCKVST